MEQADSLPFIYLFILESDKVGTTYCANQVDGLERRKNKGPKRELNRNVFFLLGLECRYT